MGIQVTIGKRTFIASEYNKLQEKKPRTLKDLMALGNDVVDMKRCTDKGRKAATYRSLCLTRARAALNGAPTVHSVYSIKHMELSLAEREAHFQRIQEQGDAYLKTVRNGQMNINYLG